MKRSAVVSGLLLAGLAFAPKTASAHFYIDYPGATYYAGPSPTPWWNEDAVGTPQKLGPCGDEDDVGDSGGGRTNVVTAFAPGATVTLQWTEVISHTGWFRVALAADRSQFVDPVIEVDSIGLSADAAIEDPPASPIIVDGLYKHSIGPSMTWPPYTFTLPTTPCAKCTIQVIQIMLDHPSNLGFLPDGAPNPDGFLYHHCMDISIGETDGGPIATVDASGPLPDASSDSASPVSGPDASSSDASSGHGSGPGSSSDAGSLARGDASVAPTVSKSSGCGCSFAPAPVIAEGAVGLVACLALVGRRRRRRP